MSEILPVLLRTVIVFVIVLFFFRITGKKEIGELSVLDVIVSLMIAELAVLAIEDPKVSMIRGLSPIFLLMFIQIGFSFVSLKSQRFRDLIEGRPVMIINNGVIDQKNMRKQGYHLDDILLQLREKDIPDIRDVRYAMLERSGTLSVFPKHAPTTFTLPFIQDGVIQEEHLALMEKSRNWLEEELKKRGYNEIASIFYCSYCNSEFYIVLKD
ncbi:DUF421 domain-containing protein [Bacillus suaedae]|uniref:DUF421 domain-containing protein n=1 Tax=Halalkalibacter suaedae TaxID=2822140 RepID=A0A940WXX1_9BACI|nr:DUF421 domain-containing protein [Bacillus suaedae]MBP3950415.1 DUF421 domain-containing protein [Bacillus suaedae]